MPFFRLHGSVLLQAPAFICSHCPSARTRQKTVKRMLSNKKYLGTDYYPQIIDEETIERFQEELTRRAGNLGRLDRKCKERNIMIPTSFGFKPAELTFADPFEQAEYIYSLIESEE